MINGVFNHIFEDQLFRLEEQCIFIVEALSERVYIFNLNRGRLCVAVEVGSISQVLSAGKF